MRLTSVLLYMVVEIGAFVAMTLTLGFGWAVLITLAAATLGFVMLRWQGGKVFGELRRASRNEVDARAPLVDTATLAASTFLLIIPGIVSTVVGIVLLAPPMRRLLRPVVTAFGARRVVAVMGRSGLVTSTGRRGTVVDGSVVVEADADNADVVNTPWTDGTTSSTRTLPRGH